MLRVGAVALVVLAISAGATLAADDPDPNRAPYPQLRAVDDLRGPQTDAGIGVYPALSPTSSLGWPPPAAVDSARRFAATRTGRVSFAVGDPRSGVGGLAPDRPYRSASLVKAMLLVARLRQLDGRGAAPSAAERTELSQMIRVSDNFSATQVYRRVRPEGLERLARAAGMRPLRAGPHWGDTQVTASDQARFFLALDALLPERERAFAKDLLETIDPTQSWGIPETARPRWRVAFKGGWRPVGGGSIVHQGALLESGARRLSIAVLSDGNPDEPYGHETIRGIAARLLRPAAAVPAPAVEPGVLAALPTLAGARGGPKALRPLGR